MADDSKKPRKTRNDPKNGGKPIDAFDGGHGNPAPPPPPPPPPPKNDEPIP